MRRTAFILFVVGLILGTLTALAWGQTGTMLQSIPVPCERGTVLVTTFDTNGDPSDGGEYHVYLSKGEVLMEMWFEPGMLGQFIKAKVGSQEFTAIQDLSRAFPGGICDLLQPKVGA